MYGSSSSNSSLTRISIDKLPLTKNRKSVSRMAMYNLKMYEDYILHLPLDYLNSIEFYIGITGFQNHSRTSDFLYRLRNNEPLLKSQLKHFYNLKKIYNYGLPFIQNMKVYRGFNDYPGLDKNNIVSPTVLSTTYDRDTASNYGNKLMTINLNPGNYTIIPIYAFFKLEKEILLPPGSFTLLKEEGDEYIYSYEPDPSYTVSEGKFRLKNSKEWLKRFDAMYKKFNNSYEEEIKLKYSNYPTHLLNLFKSIIESADNLEQILPSFDIDIIEYILKTYNLKIDLEKMYNMLIEKYDIDYKDENNYIYKDKKINILKTTENKSNNISKEEVIALYLKLYDMEDIDIESRKVSSIPLLPNLKRLRISNTRIKKLGMYPKLEILECSGCKFIKDIGYYPYLEVLKCDGSGLLEVPDNLEYLEVLQCNDTKIKTLGRYPNLIQLRCYNTKIEELVEYPNMVKLKCNNSKITKLGSYPRLLELDCSFNILLELPYYPKLVGLICKNNKIKSLPEYPKLEIMGCSNNELTSLPEYPKLEILNCSNNELRSLLEYSNLIELTCKNNKIKNLPEYPKLEKLDCSNNRLTSISKQPKLENLDCSNNQLKSLPEYPKLEVLNCNNNQIESVPDYPNIQYFTCERTLSKPKVNELYEVNIEDIYN